MTKEIKTIRKMSCDNCRKEMEFDTVELSFGYPSKNDFLVLDFCSDKCLKSWVDKNIEKENKMDKKSKLYKETNQKFIGRVQNMLYNICGMDFERAREVLLECLKQNELKIKKVR